MDIKQFVEQFYTLWTQDYWRDEIFTILLSKNSYLNILLLTSKDFNPPLFYYLTKTVINIFNDSPFYLRQIPLFFHILSSIFAYKLSRIFTSKLLAILYSLLVLTNTFLFYYAFQLRPYSAMVFLSILSVYFFLSKNKLGFVIINTIGLYTQTYYLVFYLMFFGCEKLKLINKHKNQILFLNIKTIFVKLRPLVAKKYLWLPLLFYLPWIPVLIMQTISKNESFWLDKVSLFEVFNSIATYLGDLNYVPVLFSLFILLIFTIVTFFGYKIISAKILKVVFIFGFCPILFSVLVSLISPIFTVRYLIFTVPFLLLFFIGIVAQFRYKLKFIMISLLFIIVVTYSYLDYQAFINPTNYRYGYLAYSVLSQVQTKPKQIITNEPIRYLGIKYYFEKEGIKTGNVKYFSLTKRFPHFIGDVVIDKKEIVNMYPKGKDYIYLGEKDF